MAKESNWFKHDQNARNDIKLVKLRRKHGMEAVGTYWCLIEMLYEEGGIIELEDLNLIAEELKVSEEMIDHVVRFSGLFETNETHFFSQSVNRRMGNRAEMSTKNRENALNRWGNTTAMRPALQNECAPQCDPHKNSDAARNAIERKKERKKEKEREREREDNTDRNDPAADAATHPRRGKVGFKSWTQEEFTEQVKQFVTEQNREMCRRFYEYWTEPSATGRMRFQLEKTWDTRRRLATWIERDHNFTK